VNGKVPIESWVSSDPIFLRTEVSAFCIRLIEDIPPFCVQSHFDYSMLTFPLDMTQVPRGGIASDNGAPPGRNYYGYMDPLPPPSVSFRREGLNLLCHI